jgi:hypothetical protein
MLTWFVVLAFVGVTLLAAGRLLLIWRETRGLPELLIAGLIVGVGTIGVGCGFVISQLPLTGALRNVASFVPTTGVLFGMTSLCVFTWKVYRPASVGARLAAVALVGPLAALQAYALVRGSVTVLTEPLIASVSSVLYTTTMVWSAVEAILYWTRMRKRVKLGLADPMVTNRLLLWAIATGTAGVGIAIGAVARIGFGVGADGGASWVLISYAAHGSVSAIAFWLAFKPPRAYARWIERGSAIPTGPL